MSFIVEPFDRVPTTTEQVDTAANVLLRVLATETDSDTFRSPFVSNARIRRGTISDVAAFNRNEDVATKGSTFSRVSDTLGNTVWFSYAEPIIWYTSTGYAAVNSEWFSSTTARHFSSAWFNVLMSTRQTAHHDGMSIHYGAGISLVRLNPRYTDTFLSNDLMGLYELSNTNIDNMHRRAINKYELIASYWSAPGRRLGSGLCLSVLALSATAAATTKAMKQAHPGMQVPLTPLYDMLPDKTRAQFTKARLRGDTRADMLAQAMRLTSDD